MICGPADHGNFFVLFFRHSSGRGGVGNLTAGEVPHREGAGNPHGVHHPHATHTHDAESFGRGGSGNISRDHSREPGAKDTHHGGHGHGLSGLIQSVTGGVLKSEHRGRTGHEVTTGADAR
jgi:hypothetical protein